MTQQTTSITLKLNIMKNLILTSAIILISLTSFGQTKKDLNDVPQTKKITSIQYGVQCGKTGKPAVYVYFKNRTAKDFNPATDREIVYTQNIAELQNTVQYQVYVKSI